MALESFHFLRPGWLLLLLPAALIVVSIVKRQDPMQGWKHIISPGLLKHLVVRREERRSRFRPVLVLGLLWLSGIFALAGPTWEKEPSPFTEDQAALFVVLKVTPEMLAEDIQPSRLERAVQKIGDLLALRPGTKTGLIAYAGSVHLVMPLTSDPEIIGYFASVLDPAVMPLEGDDPAAAVALARSRLASSRLPGSILLVADSVGEESIRQLGATKTDMEADVHVLAVAAGPGVVPPAGSPPAPALDEDAMRRAAKAGGGSLVLVSADDSDIRQLNARIDRSIAAAPLQAGERWKDAGYYLMLAFSLLALLFFRPGGAVALSR